MDINLYEYIFHQTKGGKAISFRLEDGFMTGMCDNGYRFKFEEALFQVKLIPLFEEWVNGYLTKKLGDKETYGVGEFVFEINNDVLEINCITELGGSFYEFQYCCLSDDLLQLLFKNQGVSGYSAYEVYLNFEYEFNYTSNKWKISGFEESGFNDGNSFKEFDFSKIDIVGLKNIIYNEIKDYSLEQIGLEKGNVSKKVTSINSSITVSEYISFKIKVCKSSA
jgi:hypothetical protein